MQPNHRAEMLEAMSGPLLRKQLVRSVSYGRAVALDIAEDAVQDAFVYALQTRRPWDGRSSLRTWFTRVAINAMRMRLRSRNALERRETELDRAFEKSAEFSAFERVYGLELLEHFERRMLTELTPLGRMSLLMVVANQDHGGTRAAARSLGVEENAFKSRVYRAREQLRGNTNA